MMNKPTPQPVATLYDLMALIEVVKSPEAFEQAVKKLFAATESYNQATAGHVENIAEQIAAKISQRVAELATAQATADKILSDARAEAKRLIENAATDKLVLKLRTEYESKLKRMRELVT
jgi:acyl-CoA reductase-like NAD-dependent aldehyde dehydrogenase